MNELLIEEVIAEVLRRQQPSQPAALLLGRKPARDLGWQYVASGDYTAVVIGSMSAGDLLHFPDDAVLDALLANKPVYVCEDGLDYRKFSRTANRALWSRLLAAERQMKQLGVQMLGASGSEVLTAEAVRRLLRDGRTVHGRLTPLAQDVLEGKA